MRPTDGIRSIKWMREAQWAGSLDVLVDTSPYTRKLDSDEWVMISRVKQGDGSPYPVIGRVPSNGAEGQWRLSEIKAVRLNAAGITEAALLPEDCPFKNMALRAYDESRGDVLSAEPTEADRLARRLL